MPSRLSLFALALCVSCSPRVAEKVCLRVSGSDAISGLISGCAEVYQKQTRKVVEVEGGGSGVGIAALIEGRVDLAMATRPITPDEIRKMKEITGHDPVKIMVGFDALAVIVHKASPLDGISIPQLREVFAEDGTIDHWEQLGPGGPKGKILRYRIMPSSGDQRFFQQMVLAQSGSGRSADFKAEGRGVFGSIELVTAIAAEPLAIGFAQFRFVRGDVKALALSRNENDEKIPPTENAIRQRTYPLARELYLYSAGPPQGDLADFLKWLTAKEGQEIIKKAGFVPLKKE